MPGVLLSGLPGVGKSTACRRIVDLCQARGLRVEGFLTEELREGRSRVGFDLVGLGADAGRRAPLARVGDGPGPRVGRYSVSLGEFEALALPVLDRIAAASAAGEKTVCIVDEIGKMELFSSGFVARVRQLLAAQTTRPAPVLFTVALNGGGLIAESKRAPGFSYVELNHSNRDGAPADIFARLFGEECASIRGLPSAERDVDAQATRRDANSPHQPSQAPRGRRRWQPKVPSNNPDVSVES